ncbi:otospiralin-like [Paramormyrops kingsleyae]|uniref:otospiralin-like n=1 Tax=Paramormyrops kingsleyae TaxID=1676925 RepID=UPI000CD5D062|nr:otospiralin-like [Paramormyrops kingsleyae]XP_023661258.1 otospiralin-like [Paramormyrops kingsleyae]
MPRPCAALLVCMLFLGLLCLAVADQSTSDEQVEAAAREKRGLPNWALTSSDFFGWVENLRAHAGYDKMEDLARTFWAHFPPASHMGYESPEPEE